MTDEAAADIEQIAADPLFKALISEPGTGVAIISTEGAILYCNRAMTEMMVGPGAKPETYIGKNLKEAFPPEWVEQRMGILDRMKESGRPVLLRTIWNGFQQFTWLYLIRPDGSEDCGAEHTLAITRRIAGDEEAAKIAGEEPYELIESDVMKLGPLDALTERELEVLALIGQGLSMKEIASMLYRSVKTVDSHRMSIGKKLDLNDRVRLAQVARRAGLNITDAGRERL